MNTHKHFHVLAIGLYLFLLVLVFRDEIFLISRISTSDPGDHRLNYLLMQWGLDWLYGHTSPSTAGLFDLGIFYPYQNSLALSSNHLGSLPVNFLLDFLSDDWFVRGNLWLYSCFIFNGLAAAYCARRTFIYLADNYPTYKVPQATITPAALAMGVAFAFSMTRVHFVAHNQTLATFALPFFLFYAWLALQSGSKTHALVAALFFSWQFYLDLHIALMAVLLTVFLLPIHLFVAFRKIGLRSLGLKIGPVLGLFSLLCLVLCTPLALKYLQTMEELGDRGSGIEGPDFSFYFKPPYIFRIYTDVFEDFSINEDCILPSILFFPLLLGVVGLFFKKLFVFLSDRKKEGVLGELVEAGVFCLPLVLWMRFIAHQSVDAHLLRTVIPGMNSIRTPGRFSILTLALVAMIVIIIAYRSGWAARYTKRFNIILLASIFVVSVEVASADFDQWSKDELPELTQVFSRLKGPTIFLPMNVDAYNTLDIMQLSIEHDVPVANGYSGFIIPSMKYLRQDETLMAPRDLLSLLMVTYDHIVFDKHTWLLEEYIAYIQSPEFELDYWQTPRYLIINSPAVDRQLWTSNENWLKVHDYFEPGFLAGKSPKLDRERWKDLQGAYDKLSRSPSSAAYISLAEELFKAGGQNRALANLEQAFVLGPYSVPNLSRIGDLFAEFHLSRKARGVYADAVKRSAAFLTQLKKMEDTQERYDYYCQLARAFEYTGHLPEARAVLFEASLLYPNRPHPYLEAARLFGLETQWESATIHYESALRMERDNSKTKISLGNIYKAMGNDTKAEEFYRQVSSLGAESFWRYQNMADLYLALGKPVEALAALERAIALEPEDFSIYWQAAKLYKDTGQGQKTIQTYRDILSLNLAGGEAMQWQEMGVELYATGHIDEAMAAYRLALKLDRRLPAARNNLGWCLYERGQLNGAISCYRLALEHGPSSAAQFNLGLALLHLGKVEEARTVYINGMHIFGWSEAEQIGALADLQGLIGRDIQVLAAKEILADISALR